jgi:hypothetical protein
VSKGTFKQDQRITCKGITTATQIWGKIFKKHFEQSCALEKRGDCIGWSCNPFHATTNYDHISTYFGHFYPYLRIYEMGPTSFQHFWKQYVSPSVRSGFTYTYQLCDFNVVAHLQIGETGGGQFWPTMNFRF